MTADQQFFTGAERFEDEREYRYGVRRADESWEIPPTLTTAEEAQRECDRLNSVELLSEHSYIEQVNRVDRQVRQWQELLGSRAEPPPYSPARASAWENGYEDALRDLAQLRARGIRI